MSSKDDTATESPWLMQLPDRAVSDNTVTTVKPYVNESDMTDLRNSFSSDKNSSPWGCVHGFTLNEI